MPMHLQCLGWKKTMMCDIDAALACGTGSAAADIGDGDVSAWCRDITNGAKPAHWNAPILVRHPRVGTIAFTLSLRALDSSMSILHVALGIWTLMLVCATQ